MKAEFPIETRTSLVELLSRLFAFQVSKPDQFAIRSLSARNSARQPFSLFLGRMSKV